MPATSSTWLALCSVIALCSGAAGATAPAWQQRSRVARMPARPPVAALRMMAVMPDAAVAVDRKPNAAEATVTLTIPGEATREVFDGLVRKAKETAVVNGFKKGTAPEALVVGAVGKKRLASDAIAALLEHYCQTAIGGSAGALGNAIGEPKVLDDSENMMAAFNPGQPLIVNLSVELWPEISFAKGAYNGLQVEVSRARDFGGADDKSARVAAKLVFVEARRVTWRLGFFPVCLLRAGLGPSLAPWSCLGRMKVTAGWRVWDGWRDEERVALRGCMECSGTQLIYACFGSALRAAAEASCCRLSRCFFSSDAAMLPHSSPHPPSSPHATRCTAPSRRWRCRPLTSAPTTRRLPHCRSGRRLWPTCPQTMRPWRATPSLLI